MYLHKIRWSCLPIYACQFEIKKKIWRENSTLTHVLSPCPIHSIICLLFVSFSETEIYLYLYHMLFSPLSTIHFTHLTLCFSLRCISWSFISLYRSRYVPECIWWPLYLSSPIKTILHNESCTLRILLCMFSLDRYWSVIEALSFKWDIKSYQL